VRLVAPPSADRDAAKEVDRDQHPAPRT
jgi:hypothetical protein